ncbi:unnamed protein product, partial [marine sediment metagenome]
CSKSCLEQLEILKSIIKELPVSKIMEIGFNAGYSAEFFLNQADKVTSFDLAFHEYTY